MANTTTVSKSRKIAPSVQTFRWKGTDSNGGKVSGEIRAKDIGRARAELRRQQIAPGQIKKATQSSSFFGGTKKIKSKDITLFTRQLATMVNSGIPLVQAFEIIEKGLDHPSMSKLIASIRVEVEGGTSLSSVLRKHTKYFDNLFVNLIAAGEQAGALDTILTKLALYREKTELIKSKVTRAMVYPAMILLVAAAVTLIILLYVIPQFEGIFQSFGADLPAFTRLVIDLSIFVREKGFFLAVLIGGGISAFL